MTHTTTDAAEARALTVIQEDRDGAARVLNMFEGYENIAAMVRAGTYDSHPSCISAARHRLATAEAASGAGEREKCGASPDHADILETIANAPDDWQKKGYATALAEVRDMANVGRALMEALPDGYHYMNCPSEIVSDLQNERDEALASLPPATAPAMVTVPREPTDAMIRAVEAVNFQTDDEHAMGCNVWQAMVAAAPTIPATGEAVKWRERWYGSDPWKGSAITDEHGNMIAYFGGDEATHAAVTKAVTAHNATIPATGHAATEGEG